MAYWGMKRRATEDPTKEDKRESANNGPLIRILEHKEGQTLLFGGLLKGKAPVHVPRDRPSEDDLPPAWAYDRWYGYWFVQIFEGITRLPFSIWFAENVARENLVQVNESFPPEEKGSSKKVDFKMKLEDTSETAIPKTIQDTNGGKTRLRELARKRVKQGWDSKTRRVYNRLFHDLEEPFDCEHCKSLGVVKSYSSRESLKYHYEATEGCSEFFFAKVKYPDPFTLSLEKEDGTAPDIKDQVALPLPVDTKNLDAAVGSEADSSPPKILPGEDGNGISKCYGMVMELRKRYGRKNQVVNTIIKLMWEFSRDGKMEELQEAYEEVLEIKHGYGKQR